MGHNNTTSNVDNNHKTNNIKLNLKIGTRKSLLAKTQSSMIQSQVKNLTGSKVELIGITTQGDLNTKVALWQMEGKDFFTKELDQNLLDQEIDLVVHSYKDLGHERPEGIELGAIPQRSYPHDILLMPIEKTKNLTQLQEVVIGTSSPRRIQNITESLHHYLPGKDLRITTKLLRGNVNTRIEKLKSGDYDGIILAMAGLERLASAEQSCKKLKDLLNELTFMILPLNDFPPAASQGALAIEYSSKGKNFDEIKAILSNLDDLHTRAEVEKERESFRKYGGGCHLAVGIHVKKKGPYFVHFHKGKFNDQKIHFQYIEDPNRPSPHKNGSIFIGFRPNRNEFSNNTTRVIVYDELISKNEFSSPSENSVDKDRSTSYFVTSNYCINRYDQIKDANMTWVSGSKTWKRLAQKEHWIHGSTDGLGHSQLKFVLNSKLLKLFNQGQDIQVKVLSAKGARSQLGDVIECYERQIVDVTTQYAEKIRQSQIFYWTSYPQFEIFSQKFPEILKSNVQHACGIGKTLEEFQRNDISVLPFINLSEFFSWINYEQVPHGPKTP